MDILWMGLTIFTIIFISFVIILGMTKGVSFMMDGSKKDLLHSNWAPLQVYSGDDSLGHPDLQRMSELQDNEFTDGTENI